MKEWIDLNADMGESFGNYVLGDPEALMEQLNHANIACGFHAGDPAWMRRSIQHAKKYDVTIGAHPGFPDRQGFGRRMMDITPDEALEYIVYQVGALQAFARMEGMSVQAAKPHGAFYSWCQQSRENARAVLEGFQAADPDIDLYLPALPREPLIAEAERMGFRVIPEFYPGLEYDDEGAIAVAREYGEENVQEVVDLVLQAVIDGTVTSINGNDVAIDVESVCVHGDVDNAPEVVSALRKALIEEGIQPRSALRAPETAPAGAVGS